MLKSKVSKKFNLFNILGGAGIMLGTTMANADSISSNINNFISKVDSKIEKIEKTITENHIKIAKYNEITKVLDKHIEEFNSKYKKETLSSLSDSTLNKVNHISLKLEDIADILEDKFNSQNDDKVKEAKLILMSRIYILTDIISIFQTPIEYLNDEVVINFEHDKRYTEGLEIREKITLIKSQLV